MTQQVSNLSGIDLDKAVAICRGSGPIPIVKKVKGSNPFIQSIYIRYSSDWNWGGPLITAEHIEVSPRRNESKDREEWRARKKTPDSIIVTQWGESPLIAAMRCFVACKVTQEINTYKEALIEGHRVDLETGEILGIKP